MKRTITWTLAVAAALAACGGGPTEVDPPTDLSGTWSYDATIASPAESEGEGGESEYEEVACVVSGVTLQITQAKRGTYPFAFTGTASGGRMECTLQEGPWSMGLPSVPLSGGLGILAFGVEFGYSGTPFTAEFRLHNSVLPYDYDQPVYEGSVEVCSFQEGERCFWGSFEMRRL